jgi:hypothetical protein
LYHHVECIFETFKRARATTKIIDSSLQFIFYFKYFEEVEIARQNEFSSADGKKKRAPKKKVDPSEDKENVDGHERPTASKKKHVQKPKKLLVVSNDKLDVLDTPSSSKRKSADDESDSEVLSIY